MLQISPKSSKKGSDDGEDDDDEDDDNLSMSPTEVDPERLKAFNVWACIFTDEVDLNDGKQWEIFGSY